MQFVHDVWVNWFEGEENGYNVCHFHEWRREDVIELLDQVPLLKISPMLFKYIENNLAELPEKLLSKIHKQAYLRKNHQRIQLDYCAIVSDGQDILVIDTLGYQIPIRKSRLIPRQEEIVYDLVKNKMTEECINVPAKEQREYHILSPSPQIMTGLTRKERQLKQLLFMALDQLYVSKNVAEVRYWYTEWLPEKYEEIQTLSFDDAWTQLYEAASVGWSNKHELLCGKIVIGQPFFEKVWEREQYSVVNERG